MASTLPARSDKSSEAYRDHEMAVASLARAHLGTIVSHIAPGLPLKSALPRVAARIGITARRAKALWHKESRTILHEEIEALERELALISERELTSGFHKHVNRLEGYAARLAIANADLHREEIDRLRHLAGRVRSVLADMEAA